MALKAAARNKARKASRQGTGPVFEIFRNTSTSDHVPTAHDAIGSIVFHAREPATIVRYADLVDDA
jgi:hypothetical protein